MYNIVQYITTTAALYSSLALALKNNIPHVFTLLLFAKKSILL